MTVKELQSYIEKHANPDWQVILMTEDGDRKIAYLDRTNSEKMLLIVPEAKTQ